MLESFGEEDCLGKLRKEIPQGQIYRGQKERGLHRERGHRKNGKASRMTSVSLSKGLEWW